MPFKVPEWKYLKYDIHEFWDGISLRKWINTNPRIVICITNVTVILLIVVLYGFFRPAKTSRSIYSFEKEWYYDLNTGQLFAAEKDQIPPIEAPSGPLPDGKKAGVRAYVLRYKDNEQHVGFLTTRDPDYVKPPDRNPKFLEGMLIKRVSDNSWISSNTIEGSKIFSEAFTPDAEGNNPVWCAPK